LPVRRRETDRHLAAVADQRRAQQPRLGQRAVEQALRRVASHAQAERLEPRALAIDQRGGPEALGESPQLALGRRPLVEIDEVDGDAPLGEEPLRLAGGLTVAEAEDLDVDCSGVGLLG
jgi:hypothetical protein